MKYLTPVDVLAIHTFLIERSGGMAGVRDMGALESALFRPQTGYYQDVIQEAAALLESLAMNHPFMDGNKRTAFVVTDIFLKENGYFLDCEPEETYALWMQWFERGEFDFTNLEGWLKNHAKLL